MINLSSPFAFDAARPYAALFLPVVAVLKEFFQLHTDKQNRLEFVVSLAERHPLSTTWNGVALQSSWLSQMADLYSLEPGSSEFIAQAPIRVWVISRVAQLSPKQRSWLSDLVSRLEPAEFYDDFIEDADREERESLLREQLQAENPGEEFIMDTAMDSMNSYMLTRDGLQPIPPDWGDVWSIAYETFDRIFFEHPRELQKAEGEIGKEQIAAWYRALHQRVRELATKKWWFWWLAERKMAAAMNIPLEVFRKWCSPGFSVAYKGRRMMAEALGVELDELEPVFEDAGQKNWAEAMRQSRNGNDAGILDEIDWAESRAIHFRKRVLELVSELDLTMDKLAEKLKGRGVQISGYLIDGVSKPPSIEQVAHCADELGVQLSELWLFA